MIVLLAGARAEVLRVDELAVRYDLAVMQAIKDEGGLVGCPADAAQAVIDISDFVSKKDGGKGCVREFIEWLVL